MGNTAPSQEQIREQLERGYLNINLDPSQHSQGYLYNPMKEALYGVIQMNLLKDVSDPLHLEVEILGISSIKWKTKERETSTSTQQTTVVTEKEVWKEQDREIIRETYTVH